MGATPGKHRRLGPEPVSGSTFVLPPPIGNAQRSLRRSGTDGSNPVPSANESVSAGSHGRCRPKSRLWRRSGPTSRRENGTSWVGQTLFGPVSLSPIDAVPLRQSSGRSQRGASRGGGRGLRHISGLCAQVASSLRCSASVDQVRQYSAAPIFSCAQRQEAAISFDPSPAPRY